MQTQHHRHMLHKQASTTQVPVPFRDCTDACVWMVFAEVTQTNPAFVCTQNTIDRYVCKRERVCVCVCVSACVHATNRFLLRPKKKKKGHTKPKARKGEQQHRTKNVFLPAKQEDGPCSDLQLQVLFLEKVSKSHPATPTPLCFSPALFQFSSSGCCLSLKISHVHNTEKNNNGFSADTHTQTHKHTHLALCSHSPTK